MRPDHLGICSTTTKKHETKLKDQLRETKKILAILFAHGGERGNPPTTMTAMTTTPPRRRLADGTFSPAVHLPSCVTTASKNSAAFEEVLIGSVVLVGLTAYA